MSAEENFLLFGVVTAVAKTVQAPLERVKLLVQCQHEFTPRLQTALAVVGDDGKLIYPQHRPRKPALYNARSMFKFLMQKEERFAVSLFRGNTWNIMRYVPAQASLLAARDSLNAGLVFERDRGYKKWLFFNVLSGGISGVFSQFFAHPFDVVRTRMAVDFNAKMGGGFEHKTSMGYLKLLIRTRGFRALYTGLFISMGGVFLYRAIYFALFDVLRQWIQPIGVVQTLAVGWVSSLAGTVVAFPCDTVRRRMICGLHLNINQTKEYKNAWHCFERIIGREGFLALFRGSTVNLSRHIAGACVLVGYDMNVTQRAQAAAEAAALKRHQEVQAAAKERIAAEAQQKQLANATVLNA